MSRLGSRLELEDAIRDTLRTPIQHLILVDLRRNLIDSMREIHGIDIEAIEMDHGWVRKIENNGLADQSSQL